ncbi:MAG: right-handed parallel beta-helix repeat-containing protein, partial [Anaerolineae bacterium]|nr:right-handed parallel beta-helix repeat-containing protein [Anaerolineae bacterium]
MIRNKISTLIFAFFLAIQMTSTAVAAPSSAPANQYYVSPTGNDNHPGTESAPWQTVKKAVTSAKAGDMIYLRGGQYNGLKGGWVFANSGSEMEPITLTNYPGEQAVLKITAASEIDRNLFRCSRNPSQPASWQTPKADYIRIIGTDVPQQLLPNGIESRKGIVMLGMEGQQSSAIIASDCDHWEVAGVDFIEVAYGIFTQKNNWHLPEEHSTDHWHVHNNRIYNYYRESGLQFDGNYNLIENNEIYKVSDRLDTPYGCQMLNLLGNNNVVRGNTLSRMGSNAECSGILFEWDISDANLIENNTITDVIVGVSFQGGDSNLIQNNIIIAASSTIKPGVLVGSYNNQITWPCDDYVNSGSFAEALLPPNDPSHPDYPYYYNPRNCHSMNNRIQNNLILGFNTPWRMYPVQENSNVFLNNSTLGVAYIFRVDPTPAFNDSPASFKVIFSKDVTGVDQNDFYLFTSGVIGAFITSVTPVSASVYTVIVNTGSGNGTIRLDVPNTATIKDLSNNNLSGLPFTTGESYTITMPTTSIDITIGGVNRGTYGIAPGSSQRVNYAGLDAGPVVVDATNDVPIIAALRDAYFVNGKVESFVQL